MFKRHGGKTGDSTKDGKARVAKTTMPELRATGDNVDLGLGLGGGLAHRVEWAGITGPMNHGSRQHILHRKTSGVKFNRAIIVTGKLANRNKIIRETTQDLKNQLLFGDGGIYIIQPIRKIPEGLTISGNGERTLRGGAELVLKLHRPGRLVVVEDVIDGFPKLGCRVGCGENKITNFIIDRGEDPTLYEGVKLEPFRVIGAGGGRFSGEKVTEREPMNEKEEESAPLFVIGLREA
ncbi:unnamed protein product [Cuscuta campestris]|uniref:Uncharacterized protein n=1 Tax=Cuscuta campestris TaxID=132261 RepID=A0A484MZ84_9ASTE|nr:unnamed protein product [Cuscuta campestris]